MENSLLKKLQIKPGFTIKVLNEPVNFDEVIGGRSKEVAWRSENDDDFDALLIFAVTKAQLNVELQRYSTRIAPKTICWIFYPKAKTALAADLNLMQSWEDLKSYQLTPCGSAAVDQIWTGIRVKPVSELKRSGVGNAEIKKNEYGEFIDVENKIVKLPPDVHQALAINPTALATYEKLAYSHRKEYVLWVLSAKQEKTRLDRIQKMVEKLSAGKKNPSEK